MVSKGTARVAAIEELRSVAKRVPLKTLQKLMATELSLQIILFLLLLRQRTILKLLLPLSLRTDTGVRVGLRPLPVW